MAVVPGAALRLPMRTKLPAAPVATEVIPTARMTAQIAIMAGRPLGRRCLRSFTLDLLLRVRESATGRVGACCGLAPIRVRAGGKLQRSEGRDELEAPYSGRTRAGACCCLAAVVGRCRHGADARARREDGLG